MGDLLKYLSDNYIEVRQVEERLLVLGDGLSYYYLLPNKENKLFDDDLHLLTEKVECDRWIINFGGVWYWIDNPKTPELNHLKYIGRSTTIIDDSETLPFLGVRGEYELLNGSRLYEDWVAKAKFLGVESLGICEKNSLSGLMVFQEVCEKNNIKPVLGATYTVLRKDDYRYDIKFYVKDEVGWYNLLTINKSVNVTNKGFIPEDDLPHYLEGLVIILDPKSLDYDEIPTFLTSSLYKGDIYYQFDTVEYDQDSRDRDYLLNFQKYYRSIIPPVAITDAYYLDREDWEIKIKLNQISGVREWTSKNQYFRAEPDYFNEIDTLLGEDSVRVFDLYSRLCSNTFDLCKKCNYQIETSNRHLPPYIMTNKEKEQYKDKYDLFWGLVKEGAEKKFPKNRFDEYLDRVEREYIVIEKGDVLDYFLILHDIISWARENDILVGFGRGSAAGSLISYALGITSIDPIKFDLLFERFLNEGRVLKSLPDIDVDFSSLRRDEVKRYMEQRYGVDQVCSVGTYTTYQLKAAFKELCRLSNIPVEEANYLSKVIGEDSEDSFDRSSWSYIFKAATRNKTLKQFINHHPEIVNSLYLIFKQPKAMSVHACATLILPPEKDIYSWIPVRTVDKDDQSILVSEWGGEELEKVGFLKEDILGIRQLDKFQSIITLVKEYLGEEIDIYSIPLDDKRVFDRFCEGLNADVFHFGSVGLTAYLKEMQPENIFDLIAAIALFRPGTMESGIHLQYIRRKHGKEEVVYDYGLEEVTKETYGLLIYQEQIMQLYQVLGGISLVEADDIRKALGKINIKIIEEYGKRFVQGAVERGCPIEVAEELHHKAEQFAKYSFNRSHAACYAITGYVCQYLKIYYPVYYWITALQFQTDSNELPVFLSEIFKSEGIMIKPPSINKSDIDIVADYSEGIIYWKLSSIKQCGEKASEQLRTERAKGEYFSFEEFLVRHIYRGSRVNKQVIENLILSGAFDEIENITDITDRGKLVEFYREQYKIKVKNDEDWYQSNLDLVKYDWWWSMQQKKVSGFAFFDYRTLIDSFLKDAPGKYVDMVQFYDEDFDRVEAKMGGYVVEVIIKNGTRGEYANLVLENNYELFEVKVWPEEWEGFKHILTTSQDHPLVMNGVIGWDSWKKSNVLYTTKNSSIYLL